MARRAGGCNEDGDGATDPQLQPQAPVLQERPTAQHQSPGEQRLLMQVFPGQVLPPPPPPPPGATQTRSPQIDPVQVVPEAQ